VRAPGDSCRIGAADKAALATDLWTQIGLIRVAYVCSNGAAASAQLGGYARGFGPRAGYVL
jgi:hypothetical protein